MISHKHKPNPDNAKQATHEHASLCFGTLTRQIQDQGCKPSSQPLRITLGIGHAMLVLHTAVEQEAKWWWLCKTGIAWVHMWSAPSYQLRALSDTSPPPDPSFRPPTLLPPCCLACLLSPSCPSSAHTFHSCFNLQHCSALPRVPLRAELLGLHPPLPLPAPQPPQPSRTFLPVPWTSAPPRLPHHLMHDHIPRSPICCLPLP